MIKIREDTTPSEEMIKNGQAAWKGMKIVYDPNLSHEGQNLFGTLMKLGPKYFNLDPDVREHVLNHEVAHNYADEIILDCSLRDLAFEDGAFITKKIAPKGSVREGEIYWEGLYGDIGTHALEETLVEALLEYESDPERLKRRSARAFKIIDMFMKSRAGG